MRTQLILVSCLVVMFPAAVLGQSIVPPMPPADDIKNRVIVNKLGMRFVEIPSGEFVMGAADDDNLARNHEKPSHRVRLSRSFYLSAYEVTVGQFSAFVDVTGYKMDGAANTSGYSKATQGFEYDSPKYSWRNTGYTQDEWHPVVNVNWYDARAFCQWLSKQEGRKYRLPTEAEWEYACRAGSVTRFTNGSAVKGLQSIANARDQSLKMQWDTSTVRKYGRDPDSFQFLSWNDGHAFTAPAGSFKPNAFGLYDMLGNAGEFCSDSYAAHYYAESPGEDPTGPAEETEGHVVRGGTFLNDAQLVRATSRVECPNRYRNYVIGFRVALEAPQSQP